MKNVRSIHNLFGLLAASAVVGAPVPKDQQAPGTERKDSRGFFRSKGSIYGDMRGFPVRNQRQTRKAARQTRRR